MAKRAKVYSVDFAALDRKAGTYRAMNMFEREIVDRMMVLGNPAANGLSERQQDTLDSVYEAIETLTPRQQEVLKLSFGLVDDGPLTELQVAERLGIDGPGVHRHKVRAIAAIKRQLLNQNKQEGGQK